MVSMKKPLLTTSLRRILCLARRRYALRFFMVIGLVIWFCLHSFYHSETFFYLSHAPIFGNVQRIQPNPLIKWTETEPWGGGIKKEDVDYVILEDSNCTAVKSQKPFCVMTVYTHPAERDRRTVIRDTWASPAALQHYREMFNIEVLAVFVMGSSNDPHQQSELQEESQAYRDIIQGKFSDDFRNVTFKAVFALKWMTEHCIQADYMVRFHDDIFVNGFKFYETLTSIHSQRGSTDKWIMGGVAMGFRPIRAAPWHKWNVTQEEYPYKVFPDFVTGHGQAISKGLLPLLYDSMIKTRYFFIDDIFIGLAMMRIPDVLIYNLNFQIKTLPPAATPAVLDLYYWIIRKKLLFEHYCDQSIYQMYDQWAEVLTDRGLLNEDEKKRLQITSN